MPTFIQQIGNGECCKCPMGRVIGGTGAVDICAYDLDTGHFVWCRDNHNQGVPGASGLTYSISGSSDRAKVDAYGHATPISYLGVATRDYTIGECGNGQIGVYAGDGLDFAPKMVMAIAGDPPSVTTLTNSTDFAGYVNSQDETNPDICFLDQPYWYNTSGQIVRFSDSATHSIGSITGGWGIAKNSPGPVVACTTGTISLASSFGSSMSTIASGGGIGASPIRITDGEYIWTQGNVYDTSGSVLTTYSVTGSQVNIRNLGDQIVVVFQSGTGVSATTYIYLYEEDGTLIWSDNFSNSQYLDLAVVGLSGDLVILTNEAAGPSAYKQLRRYDITDGTVKWTVRALDIPVGMLFVDQNMNRVLAGADSAIVSIANVNTYNA